MLVFRRARPVLALLVVALLASCTGGDPSPGPAPTASVDPGPQPEDVVATLTVPMDGVDVEVRVHPLVRHGEHVLLTLDHLLPDGHDPDEDVRIDSHSVASFIGQGRSPVNVRLVDLEGDVVHHVAEDRDGVPVTASSIGRSDPIPPEGARLQAAYAAPAPDVTSLSLFVPGAPLVADVPVIEGEALLPVAPSAPSSATSPAATSPVATPTATAEGVGFAWDEVAAAPTFPLESTSTELDGAVQTTESVERVEATLGSDVLFEFDSATLTPAAAEAVALVAERVAERAPGTVSVVGHTDDQGDDAYNLDLSQRRAQAVADMLAALVDGASYPTTVQGRGEREPLVANTSEENRALNRRVTVTLESTVVTRTDVTATGELPPFTGQTGTAGTGLRIDGSVRQWVVDATARRVHDHVVVDVVVGAVDDVQSVGMVAGFMRGFSSHRGDGTVSPHDVAARVTVLQGATRLFPVDYRVGENETWPGGEWYVVADLNAGARIDGGQSRVYSSVYPRLDVDTVVLQVGSGWLEGDFRLLDVPVADDASRATGDDG